MPRRDGTGPRGMDARTGRGMGICAGNGRRNGRCNGYGNGAKFGNSDNVTIEQQDELTNLKNKAKILETALSKARTRISELENN